jgi:hypothetical protein
MAFSLKLHNYGAKYTVGQRYEDHDQESALCCKSTFSQMIKVVDDV